MILQKLEERTRWVDYLVDGRLVVSPFKEEDLPAGRYRLIPKPGQQPDLGYANISHASLRIPSPLMAAMCPLREVTKSHKHNTPPPDWVPFNTWAELR